MDDDSQDQDDLLDQRSKTEYLDVLCREQMAKSPNLIVPWLLMSGYLYYWYDFSILSDGLFDEMCNTVMYNYGDIHHRHKGFVTPQRMAMGSLFDVSESDYPSIVKDAALSLVYKHYGRALSPTSRIHIFDDGTEIFMP